jgi:hypothetical protein
MISTGLVGSHAAWAGTDAAPVNTGCREGQHGRAAQDFPDRSLHDVHLLLSYGLKVGTPDTRHDVVTPR